MTEQQPQRRYRVRMTVELSEEELRRMQLTTDQVDVEQAADGHHDHDHPTIVEQITPIEER